MAEKKQKEQNINLIVQNQESQNEDEVVISISAIIRKLKKYFTAWFLTAIIIGGLIGGASIFFTTTSSNPVVAMVSFTYDGIEKGKNPNGTDFDPNSLKNPMIIEAAMNDCNLDTDLVETVREGMEIEGVIPEDTVNRLTAYYKVFDESTSGQMNAAQQILDTSWYSTQYTVTFNYKESGLSRSEAVQLLNAIVQDEYRTYFFKNFSYNEPLGNVLNVLKYEDYDYAEAVDMFETNLTTLRRYVNSLANDDTTRFRSSATGYTFADLRDTIDAIRRLDLDLVSSYITVNNVTKDKDRVQAYYKFRIEGLTREEAEYKEKLKSLEASIETYEKDQIFIFGSNESTDATMSSSIASEQYDKMISQKISTQSELSHCSQQINYYNQRLNALKTAKVGSTDKAKKVEEDLESINNKLKTLTENVKETADDYYMNVSLSNAYKVLVPASSDAATTVKSGLSKAIRPAVGIEALLFVAYLGYAFITALTEETRKRRLALAAEKAAEADAKKKTEAEDETEDAAEDSTEAETADHEDKKNKKKS